MNLWEQFINNPMEVILTVAGSVMAFVGTYWALFGKKVLNSVFGFVLSPFLNKTKEEAITKLKEYEKAIDTILDIYILECELKSTNPTISEFQQDRYKFLGSELTRLRDKDLSTKVVEVVNTIEDKAEDIKSFLERNK